ncbi:hypothetical protein KPL78_12380 [Roseomonas sp. HJA6]|uniref:Uncharacterized protein n=1 Tax=Roseomonas alba TaxID=2846776 RepID=A0ABS7A8M6_9PROT|nr:hypothetical protein [Neoroseomonas alba]MBW6398653.1 hypothetical protein [Neoroseomonas alba]
MRIGLSASFARRHPPTASAEVIQAARAARAAAAALAHAEDREAVPCEAVVNDAPTVGGFYPEPVRDPPRTARRDPVALGVVAQAAAAVLLAALAFVL